MIILIIILLLATILIFIAAFFLARFVAKPKIATLQDEIQWNKDHGFWRDFDKLPIEEYVVKSFDNYELNTFFIPADKPSDFYVIISHGYTSSRYGSLKYLNMYRDFGFNCIIYDDRAHGANKTCPCTMGVKESQDILAQIDYTYKRFGQEIVLGLQGESMGSALSITALKWKPDIKFVVADCGFCDLKSLLSSQINNFFHLPKWFVNPASLMCKIFFGYFFDQSSPIESLYDNEIPICFIHGGSDKLIPPHHSVNMYMANKGYKELHVIDFAEHAKSMETDEGAYRFYVNNFLMKVFGIEIEDNNDGEIVDD